MFRTKFILDCRNYMNQIDLNSKKIRTSFTFALQEILVCGNLLLGGSNFSGADLTKLGLFFLNVDCANDPRNLSLLCIYRGTDSAENLRKFCSDAFNQLNDLDGSSFRLTDKDDNEKEIVLVKYARTF